MCSRSAFLCHGFSSTSCVSRASRPDPGQIQARWVLPPELAFLVGHVDRDVLIAVSQTARREGVCAARALIARGYVGASVYYRALAQHLGLPFTQDWPEIEPGLDVAQTLAAGRVPVAGQGPLRWLVAPQEDQLRALLSRTLNYFDATQVAITTPAHLAAVVHYRAQASIETLATQKLQITAPQCSAKGAVDAWTWSVIALLAVYIVVGLIVAPRVVGDLFGALFFAGMVFRLVVAAAALAPHDPPAPILTDAELPTYTILLPLHREAEVLPDLLAALAGIDYPRTKLEVLILIEPEDNATRTALSAATLPPWMQVVFAPCLGDLRTKPRALNIGLLMASGELLTVFDAEDRPDPDQLRRAAATFSANRNLSCLQARFRSTMETIAFSRECSRSSTPHSSTS